MSRKEFRNISSLEWEAITESFNDETQSSQSHSNIRAQAKKILLSDNHSSNSSTSTVELSNSPSKKNIRKITLTEQCFTSFHEGYEKGKQEIIQSSQPPCFSNTFDSFFEQNSFYELNITDQSFYLGYINAIQRLKDAFFSLQEQTPSQEPLIERLNTLYPKENESLEKLDLTICERVKKSIDDRFKSSSFREDMNELERSGILPYFKATQIENHFQDNVNRQLYLLMKNHSIHYLNKKMRQRQEHALTRSWNRFYRGSEEIGKDGLSFRDFDKLLNQNKENSSDLEAQYTGEEDCTFIDFSHDTDFLKKQS